MPKTRTVRQDFVLDEPAFLRKIPYSLISTNLKGVYAVPARPDNFDPNTASAAELMNHGIPWRRPSEQDDPGLVAAWNNHFSRKWLAKDRIVPQLVTQVGRTNQANNWAGAVIQGTWSSVTGSWVVPTVSQPTESQGTEGGWNSSSWVGIDGYVPAGSNDVLQAGIQQSVGANGNPSYVAWFEWYVPPPTVSGSITGFSNKDVLGDTSPLSPSLAALNNNLYLSWKGDGNDNLSVSVSTDNGQTFANKYISPETSTQAAALVVHRGSLYIAWKGDNNDNLSVAIVDLDPAGNPTGFSNKVVLGETSPLSPSLASLDNNLYLTWKGDGNDNLSVSVSTDDGQTFGNKYISSETSSQAPALAANDGNLYIAWKGDNNDYLSVAAVDLDLQAGFPTGFSNKVVLVETSTLGPALASLNGYLFLSWRGKDNDNLNVNYSANDGQSFGGKYLSLETSTQAPCLAVNGGNLSIAWKGKDNDNLSVAIVDLTGFSTPSYIYQTNIVNFSVTPGDTINCGVLYFGDIAGYVEMANQTTGQHFSINLAPPPGATFDGDSIEWIMESPDGGPPISSLPSFTPVNFTSAVGCGPNNAVGNPQNALAVNVVNTVSTVLTSVTLGSNSVTIDFTG